MTTRPWYWEGNVQARLVAWLDAHGYSIRSRYGVPGAGDRYRGRFARRAGVVGECQGVPGEQPHTQARHWYAGAVFDLILYRDEDATVDLALGLPDGCSTYRRLAARSAWLREKLPFRI